MSAEHWLAWATAALALFTGLLVLVAEVQRRNLRTHGRHLAEQVRLAELSAQAARENAVAAVKSASVAEQTMRVVQRAHLAVEGLETKRPFTERTQHPVNLTIVNAGGSAAKNVQVAISSRWTGALADEPQYPDAGGIPMGCDRIGPQTIAARQSVLSALFTPQFQQGDDSRHLFVWGRVTYEDVFGVTYELGFARVFQSGDNRWSICRQSGYEYDRRLEV